MIGADITECGLEPFSQEELSDLCASAAEGELRRFGAVVNHRQLGYVANALVCWQVPDADVDRIGAAFAEKPFVSHCYRRQRADGWPYDVYAMVHARTADELQDRIAELSALVPSGGFAVLPTMREYKKIAAPQSTNAAGFSHQSEN